MSVQDDASAMLNNASNLINDGINVLTGAVDTAKRNLGITSVEKLPFMRGFVRMCDDGWLQGWHERNGGNLTYRMTEEDVAEAKPFFRPEPGEWVSMDVTAPNMADEYFTTTGTGRYFRNMVSGTRLNVGIVEINGEGNAWRIVWGFEDGARPTSEFPSHVLNHSVRAAATDGACRVMYHAHPNNVIAMTKLVELNARTVTRLLWQAMTECIVVFPMGVGVVPWMVPGGADIAKATSELMKTYDAAIWAFHGLFASGPDFDTTFGLMHTIEKAADIYMRARTANGGSDDFKNTITDEGLRAIARDFHLTVNEAFLDDSLI